MIDGMLTRSDVPEAPAQFGADLADFWQAGWWAGATDYVDPNLNWAFGDEKRMRAAWDAGHVAGKAAIQ